MGINTSSSGRVVSMDQFRGYTVAGMFLVNFLGHYTAIHSVLKHNGNYFSYADSIMPSFLFAVGFSYRLTFQRRLTQIGWMRTCLSYIRRSLALVFVSLMMYGLGGGFRNIGDFDSMPDEYQPMRAMAHAPDVEFYDRIKAELGAIKDPEPLKEESDEFKAFSDDEKAARKKAFEEAKKQAVDQRTAIQKKFSDEAAAARETFVDEEVQRRADFETLLKRDSMRKWNQERLLLRWNIFLMKLLKSGLWETLAIIGITQIVLLPVIAAPMWIRVLALFALAGWDLWMAYWFNWEFLYGYRENWMVRYFGTGDSRSWDGGFFGPLTWGIAMLGGTLTHDIMKGAQTVFRAAGRMFAWGALFMVLGYGFSCLTRLYEYTPEELVAHKQERKDQDAQKGWLNGEIERINNELKPTREQIGKLHGEIAKIRKQQFDDLVKKLKEQEGTKDLSSKRIASMAEAQLKKEPVADPKIDELEAQIAKLKEESGLARKEAEIGVINDQIRSFRNLDHAASPVKPPLEKIRSRGLRGMLVEPPFVAPPEDDPRVDPGPHVEHRALNYWMMGKRMPNLSFILFATGFAFAVNGLFVVLCDAWGIRLGIFRTFGMNPLAAYIIHGMLEQAIGPLVPHDAPLGYCLGGFFLFFAATYFAVRYLEKNEIYLRL